MKYLPFIAIIMFMIGFSLTRISSNLHRNVTTTTITSTVYQDNEKPYHTAFKCDFQNTTYRLVHDANTIKLTESSVHKKPVTLVGVIGYHNNELYFFILEIK
jgi:hypothetical protein